MLTNNVLWNTLLMSENLIISHQHSRDLIDLSKARTELPALALFPFSKQTDVVSVQPPVKITWLLWIMTLSPNRPYTIIHSTSTVRPTPSSHVDCPIHSIHATLYWPHIAAINHCLRTKFLCLSLIRHSPSWKGTFSGKKKLVRETFLDVILPRFTMW